MFLAASACGMESSTKRSVFNYASCHVSSEEMFFCRCTLEGSRSWAIEQLSNLVSFLCDCECEWSLLVSAGQRLLVCSVQATQVGQ